MNLFTPKAREFISNDMSLNIEQIIKKFDQFDICFYDVINKYIDNVIDLKNNASYNKLYKEMSDKYNETKIEFDALWDLSIVIITFTHKGIIGVYRCDNTKNLCDLPKICEPIKIKKYVDALEILSDKFVIYRGTSLEEYKSLKFGQSWTLDKAIAQDFAENHKENPKIVQMDNKVILETTINKKDILVYIIDGNEEEIVVNPNSICNDRVKCLKLIW